MPPSVKLFLDPLTYHLEGDRLFDIGNTPLSGEQILAPYAHLRAWLGERGIPVHTGDRLVDGTVRGGDVNVYASMGLRTRYRELGRRSDTILSAYFVNECPVVEPRLYADLPRVAGAFRRMYSFAPDAAMRPFLPEPVPFQPFRFPFPLDGVDEAAWSRGDRGFLTMINANKLPRLRTDELYTERLRALAFFGARGEVDLYGAGWDGPPFRVGETRVPPLLRRVGYEVERAWHRVDPRIDPLLQAARRCWRGTASSKLETLSRYTFALCFENQHLEGWVTEKVFDCLVAGTIPVYLGAPDRERWLDPATYVDMTRFSGYDELRGFLRSLGPEEIAAFREAGREYFRSAAFRPFSKQAFAERFGRILHEDAGVPA